MSNSRIRLLSGIISSVLLSSTALSQTEEQIVNDVRLTFPAISNIQDRAALRSFLTQNLDKLSPETVSLLDELSKPNLSTLKNISFPELPNDIGLVPQTQED